jgi:tetratricopeptide (TPR) repeat protein
MSKIAISYRRDDTQSTAGRLRDRLAAHYGDDNVFMDIDNIPFGVDFRKHIQQELANIQVLFAVIGKSWLGTTDAKNARINDETDFVRIEIETALRSGANVLPILVDDAKMPSPALLPESLKDFPFLNAAPLATGRDFNLHVERLIRSADEILEYLEAARQAKVSARNAEETARKAEEARRAEEVQRREEARRAEEVQRSEWARLAEEAWKAEQAQQEEDARRRAQEARQAEEARRAEDARQNYQKLIARSLVCVLNHDYDTAINGLTEAIHLNLKDSIAFTGRGIAYDQKGDRDRAIADLGEAIRLDGNNIVAYRNRAIVYGAKGDWESRAADFGTVYRLEQNSRGIQHTPELTFLYQITEQRSVEDERTTKAREMARQQAEKGRLAEEVRKAEEVRVRKHFQEEQASRAEQVAREAHRARGAGTANEAEDVLVELARTHAGTRRLQRARRVRQKAGAFVSAFWTWVGRPFVAGSLSFVIVSHSVYFTITTVAGYSLPEIGLTLTSAIKGAPIFGIYGVAMGIFFRPSLRQLNAGYWIGAFTLGLTVVPLIQKYVTALLLNMPSVWSSRSLPIFLAFWISDGAWGFGTAFLLRFPRLSRLLSS